MAFLFGKRIQGNTGDNLNMAVKCHYSQLLDIALKHIYFLSKHLVLWHFINILTFIVLTGSTL